MPRTDGTRGVEGPIPDEPGALRPYDRMAPRLCWVGSLGTLVVNRSDRWSWDVRRT